MSMDSIKKEADTKMLERNHHDRERKRLHVSYEKGRESMTHSLWASITTVYAKSYMKLYMYVYTVHLLASVSFQTTRCKSRAQKHPGKLFHNVWGVAALRDLKIQTLFDAQAAVMLDIYIFVLTSFSISWRLRGVSALSSYYLCKLRIQASHSRL